MSKQIVINAYIDKVVIDENSILFKTELDGDIYYSRDELLQILLRQKGGQ